MGDPVWVDPMNRRKILGILAGFAGMEASAQYQDKMPQELTGGGPCTLDGKSGCKLTMERRDPDWQECANPAAFPSDCERKPARNGQCPTCGTMAPKYDRIAEAGMPVEGFLYPPPERRVDCAVCNNTFRQRAEHEAKR